MTSEADTEPYVLVTHRICIEERLPLSRFEGMTKAQITMLLQRATVRDIIRAVDVDETATVETNVSFISVQKRVH